MLDIDFSDIEKVKIYAHVGLQKQKNCFAKTQPNLFTKKELKNMIKNLQDHSQKRKFFK